MGAIFDLTNMRAVGGQPASDPLAFAGKRFGPLVVGRRTYGPHRLLKVRCDCGREEFLPMNEIQLRVEDGVGCRHASCPATAYQGVLGGSFEAAVAIQLFFLLLIRRGDVASCWGGTADDLPPETPENALRSLLKALKPQSPDECWVVRVREDLPYMPGNVALDTIPGGPFADIREQSLPLKNGGRIQIRDLCSKSGKPVHRLLEEIWKTGSVKLPEESQREAAT